MHIEESVKTMISDKFFKDIVDAAASQNSALALHFGTEMRKHIVIGILQYILDFIEEKTNGLVETYYEDYNLKGHEFGFKLHIARDSGCSKQMYVDAAAAVVNAISYAFQGNSEQYDVTTSSEDSQLKVEIVSNW